MKAGKSHAVGHAELCSAEFAVKQGRFCQFVKGCYVVHSGDGMSSATCFEPNSQLQFMHAGDAAGVGSSAGGHTSASSSDADGSVSTSVDGETSSNPSVTSMAATTETAAALLLLDEFKAVSKSISDLDGPLGLITP